MVETFGQVRTCGSQLSGLLDRPLRPAGGITGQATSITGHHDLGIQFRVITSCKLRIVRATFVQAASSP